jgi:P2-related tail formation protein
MSTPVLPEFKLPVWMNQGEAVKLATAAHAFFTMLGDWAVWPLKQMDPLTCGARVLNLIAWQRDITRFDTEPLDLFRIRVKYAYANARDAGSVAGFKRIFQRLGIGYIEIHERMDGLDWDTINITMSDSQLGENTNLLDELIQHYGRTCRRYGWNIITPIPIEIDVAEFSNETITSLAILEE